MATVLWPSFLPTPEQDGYRLRRGNELVTTRFPGGPSRVRRDSIGAPHEATCTFVADSSEYTGLIGFFRERVASRSELFRMPLLIDAPVAVNHVCRVLGDPEELGATRGHAHTVRVTLEVIPNPMRSYNVNCIGGATFTVQDNPPLGDFGDFPVGRNVLLTGCAGLSNGVAVNLDGTYAIAAKPSAYILQLADAATVNPDWTTLNGTGSQTLLPIATNRGSAVILLPE